MFIIPNQETKKHLQTNKNNLSGTIFKSRNINLDDDGYIRLAQTSFAVMTEEDDADLDKIDAMYPMSNSIFLNSDEVFSGTIDLGQFGNGSGDTNRPTPSVEEDVIFYNDEEVVSDGGNIKYKSGASAWTSVTTGLSSTAPTAMAVWETEDVLAVGAGNKVKFVDSSWAISSTILTLPDDQQISSLTVNGAQLFIATRSKSGGEAKLFIVSTIQVGIDFSYGVGTFEIMSVKPFKSSVVCITSLGQLLRFNGGGFDELAQLPIFKSNIEWADANNDYSTVSNRAMTTDGDLIYINLTGNTEDGKFKVLPDFPAGVWCYDTTIQSLYHRNAPSYTRIQKLLNSNTTVSGANNNFTLTSGNLDDIITGMPIMFDSGITSDIPELKSSTAYYVIKVSSTVFKLATTFDNAVADIEIDFTGTVMTTAYFFKTNDYGWTVFGSRMALAVLNSKLFDSNFAGRIAFSGELFGKQSTTTKTAMCGVSPFLPNRGYFVTPRLTSNAIEDQYNNLYIKYLPLAVGEKIIIKYKNVDKKDYPFSSVKYPQTTNHKGSWTSSSVFTTTADLSDVVKGEEVEITAGVGSGHIAMIQTISEASGTYTVTLVEAFPFAVSGDIIKFQIDNWVEAGEVTGDTQKSDGIYKIPIGKNSKFLQVKIELRGIDVAIEELLINNKLHKPVV